MPELENPTDSAFSEMGTSKRLGLIRKVIKITTGSYVAPMLCRVQSMYVLGPRVDLPLRGQVSIGDIQYTKSQ